MYRSENPVVITSPVLEDDSEQKLKSTVLDQIIKAAGNDLGNQVLT